MREIRINEPTHNYKFTNFHACVAISLGCLQQICLNQFSAFFLDHIKHARNRRADVRPSPVNQLKTMVYFRFCVCVCSFCCTYTNRITSDFFSINRFRHSISSQNFTFLPECIPLFSVPTINSFYLCLIGHSPQNTCVNWYSFISTIQKIHNKQNNHSKRFVNCNYEMLFNVFCYIHLIGQVLTMQYMNRSSLIRAHTHLGSFDPF